MGKGSRGTGVAAALIALTLSACVNDGGGQIALEATSALAPLPSDERPQDDAVAKGKFQYSNGSYGLAEHSFRHAVEANPKSAEGWLGLAASYDRLRRFELADGAYKEVLSLQGRTLEVLNNLAYHHMLRGNLKQARALLDEAAIIHPNHPIVSGNYRLLETWKTGSGDVAEAR